MQYVSHISPCRNHFTIVISIYGSPLAPAEDWHLQSLAARSFTESSTLSADAQGRPSVTVPMEVLAPNMSSLTCCVHRMSMNPSRNYHPRRSCTSQFGFILSGKHGHDMQWQWTILFYTLIIYWMTGGFPAEEILEGISARTLPEPSFHDTELAGRIDDGSMDWSAG
jgi:hypothetical protein